MPTPFDTFDLHGPKLPDRIVMSAMISTPRNHSGSRQ